MNITQTHLIIGSLLHNVGVILKRGGIDLRSHGISGCDLIASVVRHAEGALLDCIRYHHLHDLDAADIQHDSIAYITYIADHIAFAIDNDGEEVDRTSLPLQSVFHKLHGNNATLCHHPAYLCDAPNHPSNDGMIPHSFYADTAEQIKRALSTIALSDEYINALLDILEQYTCFIPSSTTHRETADISFSQHAKLTAGIASCVYAYLQHGGMDDYKTALLTNQSAFMDEPAFLMFSCDFSGIQTFIYNVVTERALKSLRSRSFYLELLLEHIVDEILELTDQTRCNVLYTGGGHAYLLLPNTTAVKASLDGYCGRVNEWLREQYGVGLYLAHAYCACSGNALRNIPATDDPYPRIYQTLSRTLSERKLCRYNTDEIRQLNAKPNAAHDRECNICGDVYEADACPTCTMFHGMSNHIMKKDVVMLVSHDRRGGFAIPLPTTQGECYCSFASLDEARTSSMDLIRTYVKNASVATLPNAVRLYMGDYTPNDAPLDMGDLADQSVGISRVGILRMDVDNLGRAFTHGFVRDDAVQQKRHQYNTLSRTAMFSARLTLFFKYHINHILKNGSFGIGGQVATRRNVVVIYSGGDDAFIIGAWNEVIEAAVDIREAFRRYTGGALTVSCGIGLAPYKYPVAMSAQHTADLEHAAKHIDAAKDGISLFTTSENHTYHWRRFVDDVVRDKLAVLTAFFADNTNERGMAFLYRMLELLRGAGDKINIARYAYMLAKLEPKESSPHHAAYVEFSRKMYAYALDPIHRQSLTTAMYLFAYLNRQKQEKERE